ncbi:MAG: EfeM/EfeO family lipoprotein [Polyangiaceae bacterium]
MTLRLALIPCMLLALSGCSSDSDKSPQTDDEFAASVEKAMHDTLGKEVDALQKAAVALQKAAPSAARGWSATEDAAAIEATTKAWLAARAAYERSEGAIAPLFPDTDAAIDARYEDFLEPLRPDGDANLFDGTGVTGMHAIERILFADTTPASVIQVESTLEGYAPAAWPATAEETAAFKTELCQQLVKDTTDLQANWKATKLDLQGAYGGLIALMNEQREKVNKAATEEEESRYAQRTLADIRDNLAGTRVAYGLFRNWVKSKEGGADVDASIEAGFDELDAAYSSLTGDAFPALPAGFSAEAPSDADKATDFGKLFVRVQEAVDPNKAGSVVDGMNKAAVLMNFPEFIPE